MLYLLQNNADPNVQKDAGITPLYLACQIGMIQSVEYLLRFNANPNLYQTVAGITPLMIACQQGYESIVVELLQHGADPFIPRKCDNSLPIDIARKKKRSTVVRLLENYKKKDS